MSDYQRNVLFFLIGVTVGIVLMGEMSIRQVNDALIKRNLKEYDPKTGELIWIDDFSLDDSKKTE
jgi:hypothetical protein